MPEIRPQPDDIILQKLEKLKCSQNCQNIANYLIFGFGLYCTQCLSQVKDLAPDQIVNFSALSKIIVQLVEEYQKSTKSEVSHAKVTKTETQKGKAQIKKLRDSLNFEIKSLKTRTNQILSDRFKGCLTQHTLQPLQDLFQPDMTATMVMNQTQLLLKNLQILQIHQNNNNQVQYQFIDKSKNPKQVFKKTIEQYKQVREIITKASCEIRSVLDEWKAGIKNQ